MDRGTSVVMSGTQRKCLAEDKGPTRLELSVLCPNAAAIGKIMGGKRGRDQMDHCHSPTPF